VAVGPHLQMEIVTHVVSLLVYLFYSRASYNTYDLILVFFMLLKTCLALYLTAVWMVAIGNSMEANVWKTPRLMAATPTTALS